MRRQPRPRSRTSRICCSQDPPQVSPAAHHLGRRGDQLLLQGEIAPGEWEIDLSPVLQGPSVPWPGILPPRTSPPTIKAYKIPNIPLGLTAPAKTGARSTLGGQAGLNWWGCSALRSGCSCRAPQPLVADDLCAAPVNQFSPAPHHYTAELVITSEPAAQLWRPRHTTQLRCSAFILFGHLLVCFILHP